MTPEELLLQEIERHQPDRCLTPINPALSDPIPPIRHILDPLLPRGVVTLLGGHGGAGKSQLALILAAHAACGRAWAGRDMIQARALYVSHEDHPDLARLRSRRIASEYELPHEAIEANLRIIDATEAALAYEAAEGGLRRLVMTDAYHELRELAAGYGLILIDNASDAYEGNENDRRMVRAFVRSLGRIAREQDAAVVLLAHIDKAAAKWGGNGNTYSGSTAWHNSARSRLALVDTDGRLELRHEKANLTQRAEPIRLDWTAEGVLVPAGAADVTGRDADDDAAVLEAIAAAIESGADVSTARTGPANTFLLLSTFPDLPEDLRSAAGKKRFWAAISRLERSGRIVVDEYRDHRRHPKRRYLCASSGARALPHTPCEQEQRRARSGPQVSAGSENLSKPAQPAQYRSAKNGE
ncbi:hypothetical protein TspCOW1_07400 [Thiohalobacter sp. COW1]|uniref:AAA family ATPase n=1 Tax=Thiohalobacter sp. COW1 TaxID=2795687 RepID=UPI001915C4C7|nr:AAA family ATPase [Thiohalobacter sp. COW1]BCO30637.1 hypothetical protein TspCOW1_07400 [Thiohalobacter sp. COW1]